MSNKIYYYQNFDIDVNNGSLELLLWSVYAGIILGVLGSLIYRVCTHSFVDAVIKAGALNENNAVTLDSLDFRGKWYIKRQIRSGSSLARMFVFTNADTFPKKKCSALGRFWYEKFLGDEIPTVIPFETAKFYLPEERRVAAELRFTPEKRPVHTFVFTAVILAVVVAAATVAVPELLQMLDNLMTQLTPTSNVL
ncbi:MAG: hypothetical protein IJV76_07735 [Clostridia bacterium]|nr:hypothetical protein [Clostridia bacterium]